MEQTDEELVKAYDAGDARALTDLLTRAVGLVYNFAYRLVGDASLAEDITQETVVKVWKHLGRYRRGAHFKAWLFAIARNVAIDHLRKKRPVLFSAFEDPEGDNMLIDTLADETPRADELATKREDQALLDAAIKSLVPAYREVLILHYQEKLTFEEIGKIVGKPMNTVKSHHRRALEKMRRILSAPKP